MHTVRSRLRECLVPVAAVVLGTPTSACCSISTSEIHESSAPKGDGRRIELLARGSRHRRRLDVVDISDLNVLFVCYVVSCLNSLVTISLIASGSPIECEASFAIYFEYIFVASCRNTAKKSSIKHAPKYLTFNNISCWWRRTIITKRASTTSTKAVRM